MNFPDSFPSWIWVVMGSMGTFSSILVSIVIWKWIKSGTTRDGSTPVSSWSMLGLMFLFAGGLMCCGIAGPPGYALSSNPALVSKVWILRASFLSNFLTVLGWSFYLVGQTKTIQKKAIENELA